MPNCQANQEKREAISSIEIAREVLVPIDGVRLAWAGLKSMN